jgi:hypothetical protein
MRQLDEGITTEGFTLGSIKPVEGCEFGPQLLIAGGVRVGKAGAGTSAVGASSFSASVTYQSHQS